MDEEMTIAQFMNIGLSDIIWPLVVLCMTYAASVVINFFRPTNQWSGRIARGAYYLWLLLVISQLFSWYLHSPEQFKLLAKPGYYAFVQIKNLFLEGMPAALLWGAIGISTGIGEHQCYRDIRDLIKGLDDGTSYLVRKIQEKRGNATKELDTIES